MWTTVISALALTGGLTPTARTHGCVVSSGSNALAYSRLATARNSDRSRAALQLKMELMPEGADADDSRPPAVESDDDVEELRMPPPLPEDALTESQRRRLKPVNDVWRKAPAGREDIEEERGWGDRTPQQPP